MPKLKTFMMLFTFLSISSNASISHVNYRAQFGIFGTVGTIKNTIQKNKKSYKIETTVTLAGMAKVLLGGQTEHYISTGHMEDGLMIADDYIMTSIKKNQKKIKKYHIDHLHKFVIKHYQKWKNGKLIRNQKQKLDFYAKNDLLTLYFNMNNAIHKKGTVYTFKAVGLEKQKGIVKVTVPDNKHILSYKRDLEKTENWYAKAHIVQKSFRKNQGDILLSVDKDGFIKKAVIKDIMMYGDAKLLRIK